MNKKYWLRGAIILTILHTLFFVGYLLILLETETSAAGRGLGLIGLVLAGIPTSLLLEFIVNLMPNFLRGIFGDSFWSAVFMLFIINTIQYFIIGALLGEVYGKFKNRNAAIS